MRELPREKRLEIACCYLLGQTYGEIEVETGVSHGTVVNVIQELLSGKLAIPGTPLEQINDIRILALDLKKEGLQSSQAMLGFSYFQRLQGLGITTEHLENWSELLKQFAKPDISPTDFMEVAISLANLEKSQGKPFDILAEEYKRLMERVPKLEAEVGSLTQTKVEQTKEAEKLNGHLQGLKGAKNDLELEVKKETARLQDLKPKVKEAEEARSQLSRDIKDLERKKANLSAEIGGKEESLKKLDELGLTDEDLLRLTVFIDKTSKKEGIAGEHMKERFFSILSLFKDLSGLQEERNLVDGKINEMVVKHSFLTGQILELEKKKGILEGEISNDISQVSKNILDAGASGATQLAQQVSDLQAQFNSLLIDALRTAKAIGEMRALQMKGEESCQRLEDFIKEVKSKVEVRNA